MTSPSPVASPKTQWTVALPPPEEFFRAHADIHPLALRLLWNRGIRTTDAIARFLKPDYERDILDPFLFRDMEVATSRILRAVANKEKIIVFGDYDADGVCGAAVMHEFLKKIEALHEVAIPDRGKETFGLSIKKIKEFAESGARLIITIDCGVTDYDEIELARSLGMDTIVLDHHVVPPRWPAAYAIIDHKHPEETYPEHVLSGAGLSFKMVQALIKKGEFSILPGWEKWLLDLVAIAAVADMVPLTGENRALVAFGLRVLQKSRRMGIKDLFRLREMKPDSADVMSISHFIAPRINAASRMDHANTAFALLTTEHEEESRWLAQRLEDKNEERKRVVEEILGDLHAKIESQKIPAVIFEGSTEWPAGVLGLAAARLVETYQRPVFLYAMNEELVKGSCRAPMGVNVVELMRSTKNLFSDFGGHVVAGGFSVMPDNLASLKIELEEAGKALEEKPVGPAITADAELALEDIGEVTYAAIQALEPFGQENPRAVFFIQGAKIADLRKVGADGSHLKMKLGDRRIGAIYFRAGENNFHIGDTIDCIAELQENIWNGTRSIELRIIDAALSD